MTERIRRRDYLSVPDDPCISLYCFHARDYHAPNCVFSGCTCKAFEEAPTEAEAEAILREQGIDAKQLTNNFIEHLFKHIAKQAAELASREQRISELETLIIDSQKPHGTCYWGLGYLFTSEMQEACTACDAKRQMKTVTAKT